MIRNNKQPFGNTLLRGPVRYKSWDTSAACSSHCLFPWTTVAEQKYRCPHSYDKPKAKFQNELLNKLEKILHYHRLQAADAASRARMARLDTEAETPRTDLGLILI